MKKIIWIVIVILTVGVLLLEACRGKGAKEAKTTDAPKEFYTCSMHPQVIEHHPGNCPICGMKLIKKNLIGLERAQAPLAGSAQLLR